MSWNLIESRSISLSIGLSVIVLMLAQSETCISRTHAEEPRRAESIPAALHKWLQPQEWKRDTDGPILSLGREGEFDDTHIFAPCVARFGEGYYLWYSGSTGTVANRVFDLGLANSKDGREFKKNSHNPVFQFGDEKHSILTATLLRDSDGSVIREDGKLRLWFSSTDFLNGKGHHALYETSSTDGIYWEPPSEALLDHVYAPTILKESDSYRMWYTDVLGDPWVFRSAVSDDGKHWKVHPDPVLKPEAVWEKSRLFYPTVLKVDGVYLMWYGSYWSERANTTAIGLAASLDGLHWYRNPHSPVLRPDPNRPWESHYTTSQSVIRNEDGSFRIWYASRKQPPFVNKYYAINTATWPGPDPKTADEEVHCSDPQPIANGTMVVCWKEQAKPVLPSELLIHFHGDAKFVKPVFARSDLNSVLVVINFPGLSTAYSKPFEENGNLFPQILENAAKTVGESPGSAKPERWKRVSVSSFSAGYGAVREILKTPAYFERIDAIVTADSIYAGLRQDLEERKVDEQNMHDFLRFARLAVEGQKTFVMSHSSQPTPYASTTETANYLLDRLEIKRQPDATLKLGTLPQTSRASRGQFLVLGFEGVTGKDHMQHLYNVDQFWKQMSMLKQHANE